MASGLFPFGSSPFGSSSSCPKCLTQKFNNHNTPCRECNYDDSDLNRLKLNLLYKFGRISQPSPLYLEPNIFPNFFLRQFIKPSIKLSTRKQLSDPNRHIAFEIDLRTNCKFDTHLAQEISILLIDKEKFEAKENLKRANNHVWNGSGSLQSALSAQSAELSDADLESIITECEQEYQRNGKLVQIFGAEVDRLYHGKAWKDPNQLNLEFFQMDAIAGLKLVSHKKINSCDNRFEFLLNPQMVKNPVERFNSYYLAIKASVYDAFEPDASKWPKTPYNTCSIRVERPKYRYEQLWDSEKLTMSSAEWNQKISLQNSNSSNNSNASSTSSSNNSVSDDKICTLVRLDSIDEDYTMVRSEFERGCRSNEYKIVSIYKIINSLLEKDYESFRNKTLTLNKNDASKLNEMCLWHGTELNTIVDVAHQGFLQAFSSRAAYGKGTYFAVKSQYSASPMYSKPDQDGVQHMLNCSVVVGEYVKGEHSMNVPPVKNGTRIRYESTVNDVTSPTIIVAHTDHQALPRFVVSFKKIA